MRIKSIELRDFRGIREMTLVFPEERTSVLVGVNGVGKSSVLDCVAIMLSRLIGRIRTSTGTGRYFTEEDINNKAIETSNTIEVMLSGERISWTVTKTRHGRKQQSITHLEDLKKVVERLASGAGLDAKTNIPVAVYYHVNRAVIDIPLRIRGRHEFSQLATYDQALTGARNDFRIFFEWFRKREDVENEALRDAATRSKDARARYQTDRQLDAVRKAVEGLLPGFTNLRVRRQPSLRMTVEKQGNEVIVNQLSDGEKCLLAMVGDLARRLAIANPSLSDPLLGRGVVMIDEVDLHLHPQWQRMIISSLERTFPKCQFILTTHSPQVLSYVKREQVFIIEDFNLIKNTPHTYGRDVNSILFELMGVLERPQEVKDRLRKCFRLIEQERFKEARAETEELGELLGPNDADVLRAKTMLNFLREK